MRLTRKFGFDLDNTLVNYDRAARHWAKQNQLGEIKSVDSLKEFYHRSGEYTRDWLVVQEWLYTEGLNFAKLASGATNVFETLKNLDYSIVIISHKSSHSALSLLDLRSPAKDWLANALRKVNFNIEENLFFEESRSDKISRIKQENVTNFVDDLLEVFLEPEFPSHVKGFWLNGQSKKTIPVHVTKIYQLQQIIMYV